MSRLTEFSKRKIELDERRKLFSEIQSELAESGEIPAAPVLYARKYRKVAGVAGLSLFGVLVGEISIVIAYAIWNLLLHINLNP